MSRRIIAGVLVIIAAGVAGALWYVRSHRDAQAPPTVVSSGGAPDASGSAAPVARGEVTIDARRQQLIGVRTALVERSALSASLRTTGVVRADETRQTDVNVKIDGWIRELFVDYTGQAVQRGDRLFTLYSPELLATQHELLLAVANRAQAQSSPIADARVYADQLVEAARRRLTLWDLSPEQIQRIESAGQPLEAITVAAPASGIVTEKQAIAGMRVLAGQTLYRIADFSSVWVEADVYEQELARVSVGQAATVTLDAYPERQFAGRAIYVFPTMNEATRTGRVRFQFRNPGGLIKPGMFASVEMHGNARQALSVPVNAVVDSGREQIVFVAEGEGMFTPRRVRVGEHLTDRLEILDGVKEGERVAESATFFLDSESQLRAGLQGYEPLPAAAVPAAAALDISFRPLSDPPKMGDNTFEVTVKDQAGTPLTDADVSVTLFMPAMPTMNMPAMRNETRLPSAGEGVYRGAGQVMMGGHWDATVTVSKSGRRLASKQFALVAK